MQLYEQLQYWITERYAIMQRKEGGDGKPWSRDPVFQTTYFCNVRREDDKVTKWIRNNFSQAPNKKNYEWLMGLSRLLNHPPSLELWGHPVPITEERIAEYTEHLKYLNATGTRVWGNAYVVTTHGMKMNKLDYLCHVLTELLPVGGALAPYDNLYDASIELQKFEGFGSFMTGQVLADLKNTGWHHFSTAKDWYTFSVPGPGSLRGMEWLHGGNIHKPKRRLWPERMKELRERIWDDSELVHIPKLCAQDIQNCLCEFDKYCRVFNSTGKSKRKYNGN